MTFDTSLKRLFQRPPRALLSYAAGEPVTVRRMLLTDSIVVENLHPDLLFETDTGEILHTELQGYSMLVLSGLRRLKELVRQEVERMPISIDVHENEFLEEIWQEGFEEVSRRAWPRAG